jgi:hypothetical protein
MGKLSEYDNVFFFRKIFSRELVDTSCQCGTIKSQNEGSGEMDDDRREELLRLFDGLDEAGQLAALEAARKIKDGEVA